MNSLPSRLLFDNIKVFSFRHISFLCPNSKALSCCYNKPSLPFHQLPNVKSKLAYSLTEMGFLSLYKFIRNISSSTFMSLIIFLFIIILGLQHFLVKRFFLVFIIFLVSSSRTKLSTDVSAENFPRMWEDEKSKRIQRLIIRLRNHSNAITWNCK